jgi:DNA modification methylase
MNSDNPAGIRPVLAPNVIHATKVQGDEREHNAQKPIEVIRYCLEHCTEVESVIDLFGGSGSTLIAAAELGMTAYLSEIEPKYCDMIRRRWTRYARERGIDPGPDALD